MLDWVPEEKKKRSEIIIPCLGLEKPLIHTYIYVCVWSIHTYFIYFCNQGFERINRLTTDSWDLSSTSLLLRPVLDTTFEVRQVHLAAFPPSEELHSPLASFSHHHHNHSWVMCIYTYICMCIIYMTCMYPIYIPCIDGFSAIPSGND